MKGRPLEKSEWKTLLKRNSPRDSELNILKLLPLKLSLMASLREIEITLLPISAIVTQTGNLNEIFVLPSEIAHNGRERPILLNPELQSDIEEYIGILKKCGVNQMPHTAYCGFDPNAAFVVNAELHPYKTQSRGQLTSRARIVPQELNRHLDTLISNANLDAVGITRLSLIRTFVTEAIKARWALEDIALLSGMSTANVKNIAVMGLEQYAPLTEYFKGRDRVQKQKIKRLEQVRRWTFN